MLKSLINKFLGLFKSKPTSIQQEHQTAFNHAVNNPIIPSIEHNIFQPYVQEPYRDVTPETITDTLDWLCQEINSGNIK